MLTASFILTGLYGHCQNGVAMRFKEFYRGKGIIFNSDYEPHIKIEEGAKQFTPSSDNIKMAEAFLVGNLFDVEYNDALNGVYEPSKLKERFSKYNRQYIGYITKNLDSVVIVHLLNFGNKRKAAANFEDWENDYLVGFGKFYEKNVVTFLVNLTTRSVSFK